MKGRISRFESFGAVDGPGLRFVVFFQGCNLRCACCHNPETWDPQTGIEYTAEQIIEKIIKYKNYFGKEGGVTFSGGEPLLQPKFLAEIAKLCKREGIHTALDTNGSVMSRDVSEALKFIDLVLLDVKMTNEEDYAKYAGGSYEKTCKFLDMLENMKIKTWIRQVIIPGINDREGDVKKLNLLYNKYKFVNKVELLPFKKFCSTKYDALGISFKFAQIPECDDKTIEKLKKNISIDGGSTANG